MMDQLPVISSQERSVFGLCSCIGRRADAGVGGHCLGLMSRPAKAWRLSSCNEHYLAGRRLHRSRSTRRASLLPRRSSVSLDPSGEHSPAYLLLTYDEKTRRGSFFLFWRNVIIALVMKLPWETTVESTEWMKIKSDLDDQMWKIIIELRVNWNRAQLPSRSK